MNPWTLSTPPPQSDHVCPRCGRTVGTADIHTLALGVHRKAFYVCANCGEDWTRQWSSVDRSLIVSADEVLSVHEAVSGFQGKLTDLLEGGRPL